MTTRPKEMQHTDQVFIRMIQRPQIAIGFSMPAAIQHFFIGPSRQRFTRAVVV